MKTSELTSAPTAKLQSPGIAAADPRFPKVAYVMSRFPHLPETFILREMTALEEKGWSIALYPIILQEQPIVHQDAQRWVDRARRLGLVSISGVWANIQAGVRNPLKYARIWQRVLWENCSSLKFLLRSLALLPKSVQLAGLMKQEGIEHIHAHYATHPALVAWIIHQLTGINYSITAHAHDIYVQQEMLTTKLRDATFIAAISNFNREFLAKHSGAWIRDKTHVVHCGIIPQNYAQKQLRHDSTNFELLCTGSLQPYKGHKHLIEACRLLNNRGIPVHCSIIGGGDEQADLESRIRAAQLGEVVTLLGPLPQEEVARRLPTVDCYVQPSIITPEGKMEGIPVSIMEALACALPVVASDISGISELVRPGETGYLVPEAEPMALANALEEIYRNPDRAAELAAAGQELVLKEFELAENVELLEKLFLESSRGEL